MSNDVYKHSGVDIDAANNAKNLISKQARTTFSNKVIGDIGGFGSLYDASGYNDPVIVSHIDNVGTKLRIASALNNYSTDFTTGAPYVMFPGTDYAHVMIPSEGYYHYQEESEPKK